MKKVCIWAVLLWVGCLATAQAHSHLRSSTPAEGSTGPAPLQAVLGFSESSQLAA